ncbi:hypothetical protein NQ317_019051 [Molorchus minor]|uniref:Neurotransmitter-gated ion-channel transmembrane domain-containing protein n=1 Tax=Molorchus minor TaxID=1323400 RepID=A0ABQ9JWT3_9CUCU|nr:hypothetical protein NQ317_019051 [Molorchus minor]
MDGRGRCLNAASAVGANSIHRPKVLHAIRKGASALRASMPKIKDVNVIDKYSRIVFPVTFLLFNIGYWLFIFFLRTNLKTIGCIHIVERSLKFLIPLVNCYVIELLKENKSPKETNSRLEDKVSRDSDKPIKILENLYELDSAYRNQNTNKRTLLHDFKRSKIAWVVVDGVTKAGKVGLQRALFPKNLGYLILKFKQKKFLRDIMPLSRVPARTKKSIIVFDAYFATHPVYYKILLSANQA